MFTGLAYLMRDRLAQWDLIVPPTRGGINLARVMHSAVGFPAVLLDTCIASEGIKQTYKYATNALSSAPVASPAMDEFRRILAEHTPPKTSPVLMVGSALLGTAGAFLLKDVISPIQHQWSRITDRLFGQKAKNTNHIT